MVATAKPIRLADLAAELDREFAGDGSFSIEGVASLESATANDLVFVRSRRWLDAAEKSEAGAFLLPADLALPGRPVLRSPNPALDFVRAIELLVLPPVPEPGVSPAAFVHPRASVDRGASIGPGCVVSEGASVGDGSVLHANVTLYPDVLVGDACVLHAGVVIREGCRLGNRVILQPSVVVGGDGFGFLMGPDGGYRKVPQLGRVVIDDDVEIGANTTVDRGALDETRIRRGAKIDNLVQVGHNCDIGEDVVIVAQTGLSGSTVIGRRAMIMAQAGAAGHLKVGEGAFVGARAGLHKDVAPGSRVWGTPQLEERAWHRAMAALSRLPEALRRLRAIERKLGISRASGANPRSEDLSLDADDREPRSR